MIPGADPSTELNARTRWIKAQMPSASISIHCNAAADPAAHGVEIYHYPADYASERLAKCIYKYLLPALNITDRGVKVANFAMTREPSRVAIPAVLIELAFISNPAEERLLTMQSAQDQAAAAIVKGVLEYMGVENSVQPAADPWAIRVNDAVKWVQDQGISDGLRPYENLTRGEFFVILQNAKEKGII
jgi:N-acetylmuramoyl-L-alanine amidase